jgi:N4-gp56 family major capsid protein
MADDQQLWVTDSLGGYLGNAKLSKQLRFAAQPLMKFRQFVQVREALGKNKNDTVYFDKISNINTAGGTLIETDTIPENAFTIERGTIVVTEYGNSIPYSGKLDALAEFDVDNAVMRVLRDDMAKILDKEVAGYFDRCELKWSGQGTGSYNLETCSDGTATQTADGDNFASDVTEIVAEMKINNVPTYDGQNYICIAAVNFLKDVKKSTDWTDAAKYGDPERLFSGEVGRFGGCRFIEETNYLSNTQGTTSLGGEAVFFGGDAIMEAVCIPEELRAKIPTDYGRSRGVAWYGLMGFAKIWDVATDAQPHIIHVNPV